MAQEVLGEGLSSMAWDVLAKNAGRFDPRMMAHSLSMPSPRGPFTEQQFSSGEPGRD